jgi:hypothetical protein
MQEAVNRLAQKGRGCLGVQEKGGLITSSSRHRDEDAG